MKNAYATLLCGGDAYVPGAEALGRSLKGVKTREPKVLMATSDVSDAAKLRLAAEDWLVCEVEAVDNPNPITMQLFPRFHEVFTKLRAWELTEFEKIVFLDADTIVRQNIDDLFERPEIAAAPDFFLPDRFNSGVMVLDPSKRTFARMVQALSEARSYDGGDQGFLNTFFADWYAMPVAHRLPAGYNLHHFVYQFLRNHPSLKHGVEREIKVIHYTLQKPWLSKPTLTGGSEIWWEAYFGEHPELDRDWKRKLHAMEDLSFDRIVAALAG